MHSRSTHTHTFSTLFTLPQFQILKVGSGLPKELEGGFLASAKPLVDTTAAAVWERIKQVVPVKTAQAKNKGEDGKEVPATGFDAICEYCLQPDT